MCARIHPEEPRGRLPELSKELLLTEERDRRRHKLRRIRRQRGTNTEAAIHKETGSKASGHRMKPSSGVKASLLMLVLVSWAVSLLFHRFLTDTLHSLLSSPNSTTYFTTKAHSHITNTDVYVKSIYSSDTNNTLSLFTLNTQGSTNTTHVVITKTHASNTNIHAVINNKNTYVPRRSIEPQAQANAADTYTSTSHHHGQPPRNASRTALPAILAGTDVKCEEQYQGEGARRLVVLWTPFWNSWKNWRSYMHDHGRLKEGRCPKWRCDFLWGPEVTAAKAASADAVVFFSLQAKARPLPPRSPQALWIWLELEAPPISQLATGSWSQLEEAGVFFNATLSYHHQSSVVALLGQLVPLSTPHQCPLSTVFHLNDSSPTNTSYSHHMREFGVWVLKHGKKTDSRLRAQRDKQHGGLLHRPGDEASAAQSLTEDNSEKKIEANKIPFMEDEGLSLTAEEIKLATRPRIAAWMASHCPTDSRREVLVAALQRFLAVTTVGKCGKLKCGKNHMDTYCYKWLAASHLFYLSFENAVCEDYHTEKLWRALEHGMVPVVYGGPSYRHILPFDSYINVANFSNAAALATHLLHLATHPSEYLRHLQWRRYWWVRWPVPWCDLCAALHRQAHPTHTTLDLWRNSTTTCYDPLSW